MFILISGSHSHTSALSAPHMRKAYNAVGRIGRAHGEQSGEDGELKKTLGSAVLIAPNSVLTNYHVWVNSLGHTSQSELSSLGVEFEARSKRSQSTFVPFKAAPPLILPYMDGVILTLSSPARRAPILPIDRCIENETAILIGYPAAPRSPLVGFEKLRVESIYGAAPEWDVKRRSKGRVIRLGAPPAPVEGDSGPLNAKESFFYMASVHQHTTDAKRPVLCHSASSIDGNSGGALISAKTGEFIGLHCGGDYIQGRDINFAVPARELRRALAEHLPTCLSAQ